VLANTGFKLQRPTMSARPSRATAMEDRASGMEVPAASTVVPIARGATLLHFSAQRKLFLRV